MTEHVIEFEKPLNELRKKIEELRHFGAEKKTDMTGEISMLEEKLEKMKQEIYSKLEPWQVVQIMRHPKRPKMLDFVSLAFTDFVELHGDRAFKDDKAMVGGTAKIDGRPVMIIGLQKGKDTKENLMRNFGMSQPEGYRKALRLMRLAEKFSLPIVTFIDTAGAYPGLEGEERGVAEAIARNLLEMARLKTPIVVCVIGEGGSGGALGIGVGDKILMMKYATYSVISFEGAAAILWKDSSRSAEAAKVLKPTATDLLKIQVIDEIIDEPLEGAHKDAVAAAASLKEAVIRALNEVTSISVEELVNKRYLKFRNMGIYKDARFENM